MFRLSLILLFLLLFVASAKAQRRLVVVDVETLEPVTNANVTTHDGVWDGLDGMGERAREEQDIGAESRELRGAHGEPK